MKNRILTYILTLITATGMVSCNKTDSSENRLHDIVVSNNNNCVISTNKTQAYIGENIEVYVTDIRENYYLKEILVNKKAIEGTSFVMPNETAFVDAVLEEIKQEDYYSISLNQSKYAVLSVPQEKYRAGDLVELDYECKGNYILSSFYVDGSPIYGTSFVMPSKDVVVSAEFENVFKDTDWQVSSTADIIAKSFWYIDYQETGLHMKVLVDDRIVCGYEIAESELYRDNIDFIISKKIDDDVISNNTYRVVIPAIGDAFIYKGNNGSWQRNWPSRFLLSYSSLLKHLDSKDGFNGYEISIFVAYELLGVSKEEALNNISMAIAIRNATHYGSTIWNNYKDNGVNWDKISTHPLIKQDGSMILRNI